MNEPPGGRRHAAQPDRELLWSDPFERLALGQRFSGAERTVGEADVNVFAALTGDSHPQHCDPEWARTSPFGARIAHGMLILSFAVGLIPLDPERVLALRRVHDATFKRPVRLGDTISVAGELTALRPVDERTGLVEFTWEIRNQDRALVCRAKVALLWSGGKRAEPSGSSGFWHDDMLGEPPAGEFTPLPL